MNILSPGVYVNERDFSDYLAGQSTTVLALVGVASRGPIDDPTFLTSPDQYLSTFGKPDPSNYGAIAALNYLRRGNSLWYNRVAMTYTNATAILDSLGSPSTDGRIYTINVESGHALVEGNFVRISQEGKATTQNLLISDITGNAITFATPLNDEYDASSDVRIDSAAGSAAGNAEAILVSRYHGSVTPVVRFKARYSGAFANFGAGKGISIDVTDGGQFANIDSNGDVIESEGIPLQGVMPSAPSVDTAFDLIALTVADGVRVGQTRGVNYATPVGAITSVADSSGRLALNVNASSGFTVGGDVEVSGTSVYDGEYTVHSIPNGTTVVVSGFSGTITPGAAVGFVEAVNERKFGTVYKCSAVTTTGSTWTPVGVLTKKVTVLVDGVRVESFDNIVGYDPNSPNFWDTVIGSEGSPKSNYITCAYLGVGGEQPINSYDRVNHPNNPVYNMGTTLAVRVTDSPNAGQELFDNTKGFNGDSPTAADYIGVIDPDSGEYSGLQHFRKKDEYDINMLAVPGISTASVLNELISVLEYRKDCFGFIDPPFGLSKNAVRDWHNGAGVYSDVHAAFVTNKAALYHPWVKSYDPYLRRDIWMPPSSFVPGGFADTDRRKRVWQAPAGTEYGKVPNAVGVETTYTEQDRDASYGPANGNAINPIVKFNKDGIVVYGQRTLQRHPSALDRINVRRMMFELIKVVAQATRRLNFEQNGPQLWQDWLNLVDPAFSTRKNLGALEWYFLKCDEQTNDASRRNNNQSYAKIYVIPTKASEAFELEFTLLPSGIDVNEFIARDINGSTVNLGTET